MSDLKIIISLNGFRQTEEGVEKKNRFNLQNAESGVAHKKLHKKKNCYWI